MDFDVLFAGVPVKDFAGSRAWYERFFGRPADVVAHDQEVMWRVTEGGWLYILRDPIRAGTTSVAIAVPSIEEAVSALEERGVATGGIEHQGGAGRKATAWDPDGNSIAVIQIAQDG
jgi:predicted enzyme related to lactoylglutathione lyase